MPRSSNVHKHANSRSKIKNSVPSSFSTAKFILSLVSSQPPAVLIFAASLFILSSPQYSYTAGPGDSELTTLETDSAGSDGLFSMRFITPVAYVGETGTIDETSFCGLRCGSRRCVHDSTLHDQSTSSCRCLTRTRLPTSLSLSDWSYAAYGTVSCHQR